METERFYRTEFGSIKVLYDPETRVLEVFSKVEGRWVTLALPLDQFSDLLNNVKAFDKGVNS